jgi:hypothetical protein
MVDQSNLGDLAQLELEVMGDIAKALSRIPEDGARRRILDWAYSRFNVVQGKLGTALSNRPTAAIDGSAVSFQDYASLGDLFAATDPSDETERALVAAIWVQTHEGNGSFSAQAVNGSLTHMGHGVSNITRTLGTLMTTKPRLVIQLEKAGKSRQARKTYKVTLEGERTVRGLLTRTQETN